MVVEWLNVSGGADASPDWMHTHVELIRRGYAWVGVSAQAVGVNGLKGVPPQGDPVRYADLSHPGDSYSYDIYSQAGQVIRDRPTRARRPASPPPARGGRVAVGRSHGHLHRRGAPGRRRVRRVPRAQPAAGSAPLSQPPLPAVPTPSPTLIRDDLDVPVLAFNTETDTGSVLARQPDSARYRLWEVAGTADFDQYGLMGGATDTGRQSSVTAWFDSMLHPTNQPSPGFTCGSPINSGPQTFVLRAAVAHLDRWVARGTPPPIGPRWETVSTAPVTYAVDADGIVRGGIRTPAVDAPVALLSGLGQTGTTFCFLFGTTTPFTPEQLEARYGTPGGFVWAWGRATWDATAAGFLVPEDAVHLFVAGAQAGILR